MLTNELFCLRRISPANGPKPLGNGPASELGFRDVECSFLAPAFETGPIKEVYGGTNFGFTLFHLRGNSALKLRITSKRCGESCGFNNILKLQLQPSHIINPV